MAQYVETLILGAGPAGMSCAMELHRAGRRATVVEKEAQVGGLAKTLQIGEFRTDIGPHRFYSKNKYLYDFIEDLLGEKWIQIPRFTRFYVEGKFYLYPVQIGNALKNMGWRTAFRVIRDYCWEQLRGAIGFGRAETNFEDYAVSKFGRELARFNMINYTEKIWGIPCKQISSDWASQRIAGLSLFSAVKAAFTKNPGPRTLVDSFYYPELGTGLIYEAIAERISKGGSTLLLRSTPMKVRHDGRSIVEVEVNHCGETVVFRPTYLVNSTPILKFVRMFDSPPPPDVLEACNQLDYRSQVYLFITLNKAQAIPDNWIYFPDKSIPFGRVSEMKNFSKRMAPEGNTSLLLEFFVFEGDDIWNMDREQLLARCMPHLERIGLLRRDEIIDTHLFRMSDVYPVYRIGYREHLDRIKKWLDGFENLLYIGRPGRFRYNNQDHSIEMGILSAQSILKGCRMDIENVGAEREHFEKGLPAYQKSFQHQVLEDRGA